jgi:hypothetical protein
MERTVNTPVLPPAELCGCLIDSVLSSENQTYLGIGPGGRGIVLKKLDPDCLWEGNLHPNVKDRLSRVRELAHPGLANLFGVARDGEDAYAMWEFIDGMPLDEHATPAERSPRELASIARELILTVDLLHMQGIVHGALIASNVIVTPSGAVRLTHVSPLLYTDPAVDIECVVGMLEGMLEHRGDEVQGLRQLLAEARLDKMNLRALGTRVALLTGSSGGSIDHNAQDRSVRTRRRAFFGAALALALGLAAAWGIWGAIQSGRFSAPAAVPASAIEASR